MDRREHSVLQISGARSWYPHVRGWAAVVAWGYPDPPRGQLPSIQQGLGAANSNDILNMTDPRGGIAEGCVPRGPRGFVFLIHVSAVVGNWQVK